MRCLHHHARQPAATRRSYCDCKAKAGRDKSPGAHVLSSAETAVKGAAQHALHSPDEVVPFHRPPRAVRTARQQTLKRRGQANRRREEGAVRWTGIGREGRKSEGGTRARARPFLSTYGTQDKHRKTQQRRRMGWSTCLSMVPSVTLVERASIA